MTQMQYQLQRNGSEKITNMGFFQNFRAWPLRRSASQSRWEEDRSPLKELVEELGSFVPIASRYQHSPLCTQPVFGLTDMGVITEFREIGIKGNTKITQMQKFVCQRVKL